MIIYLYGLEVWRLFQRAMMRLCALLAYEPCSCGGGTLGDPSFKSWSPAHANAKWPVFAEMVRL